MGRKIGQTGKLVGLHGSMIREGKQSAKGMSQLLIRGITIELATEPQDGGLVKLKGLKEGRK